METEHAPDKPRAGRDWKRFLSPPFFLAALLAFLLPFFAVTCSSSLGAPGLAGGENAADVTGLQLITGQATEEIEKELTQALGDAGNDFLGEEAPLPTDTSAGDLTEALGGESTDVGSSQVWAIAAAALLGVVLSFFRERLGGIFSLGLGAVGVGLLLTLSAVFSSAIRRSGEESGLISETRMGFTLAVVGFILAATSGLVRLLVLYLGRRAKNPSRVASPPDIPIPSEPPPRP